jgi:hypothetical protein
VLAEQALANGSLLPPASQCNSDALLHAFQEHLRAQRADGKPQIRQQKGKLTMVRPGSPLMQQLSSALVPQVA